MRVDNKVKQKYINLVKDGFYIRPCKYENTTIYEITKDSGINLRSVYGEVNKNTAKTLSLLFGFIHKNETEYYGKATPVSNYHIRKTYYN